MSAAVSPTRPKVKAAAAGAGSGGLLAGLIIWMLGAGPWGAGWDASQVSAALAAVPGPLIAVIVAAAPAIGGWITGYLTPDIIERVIQGTDVTYTHERNHGGDHRQRVLGQSAPTDLIRVDPQIQGPKS